MFLPLALSTAHAFGDPACFPLRHAILGELERERRGFSDGICTERVFVEEWSACEGRGAGGSLAVPLPPDLGSTGEVLSAAVEEYNRGPGLDYELVEQAGGWVVRPLGVQRVFDTIVRLDPARFPLVAPQFQDLKDQLRQKTGIHIGVTPMPGLRDITPTSTPASESTLLEAIARIHRPLEEAALARQTIHDVIPRFGMYVSVFDADSVATTQLIRCEDPLMPVPQYAPLPQPVGDR